MMDSLSNEEKKKLVDSMRDFASILNDKSQIDNYETPKKSTSGANKTNETSRSSPPISSDRDGAEYMKDMLHLFQEVSTKTTKSLLQEANIDNETREALITQHIDDGIRIGTYEIHVFENHNQNKRYRVVETNSRTALLDDIILYETARGIVRRLNSGGRINDHVCEKIVDLEYRFKEKFLEAKKYKRKAQMNESRFNSGIYLDRAQEAHRKALLIKKQLVEFVSRLNA